MNVRILLLTLLSATAGHAQGFAGLGQGGDGFVLPRPDPDFEFPADHGPHPDFRIEWWYLTSSLQDADGTRYGV